MSVPFIVTMDLELAYDHDMSQQRSILHRLQNDLAKLNLRNTIFCTSDTAERFEPEIRELIRAGHELGCHGKTHALWENFETMDYDETKAVLTDSVKILKQLTDGPLLGFRGPRMETSATTQTVIEELGFRYDFSLSSRRVYFPVNLEKFFAPQKPYHSAHSSPFRRGSRPLLSVPLTSFGIPFLSGILYILGPTLTKIYASFLLWLCRITKRPLVYLYHSYEFTDMLGREGLAESQKQNPFFVHKPFRQKLYRYTPEQKYQITLDLFNFIINCRHVENKTGKEFYSALNEISRGPVHAVQLP